MKAPYLLEARGIKRVFGRGAGAVTVLNGVNLTIERGKLIALRGRSGSGKTTLINLLSALDLPTAGEIIFEGQDLAGMTSRERDRVRKYQMGLIFQSFALLPLMSAYENVEFIMRVSGKKGANIRQAAATRALEQVGLTGRMHHRPFEMSGGEQQRTAIARAIVHNPRLLLADEPTAELDSRTGLQIIKVFRDLIANNDMSIVLTTHDPAIMDIVDEVYELEDGRIVGQT